MIKNLRKRFIFAAMASTFGVLFVIMSILNIANYARMVSRADDTLSELVDNNGQFDRRDFLKEKVKTNADSQPPDKPDGKSNDKFSPETPFQTRYFSVVVSDGAVERPVLQDFCWTGIKKCENLFRRKRSQKDSCILLKLCQCSLTLTAALIVLGISQASLFVTACDHSRSVGNSNSAK